MSKRIITTTMNYKTPDGRLIPLASFELGMSPDPIIAAIELLNFRARQIDYLIEWTGHDGPMVENEDFSTIEGRAVDKERRRVLDIVERVTKGWDIPDVYMDKLWNAIRKEE